MLKSYEHVNNLISEIYSFSFIELKQFENHINFDWLSRNKNIKWSLDIIAEFYSKWNWDALDENRGVFDNITLALFFPEKLELAQCACWKKENFCEDKMCPINSNKFFPEKSQQKYYPDDFIQLHIMCDSGFIDSGMIAKFYELKDPEQILAFRITL